ncbi:ABC transporter permease [Microbulbifer elongatus]|uniref:ABC transporter permease n=1 Tax=Microbulbifer elongatus TaxID=86173 RepID=UPI00210EDF60
MHPESFHLAASLVKPAEQRGFAAFADLVWTKARLNLKSEANRSYLSYLWWVIEPLMYMVVFYFVFGVLMQRGEANFIAYLLTGLIPFQWFGKTVAQASNSIVAGRGLLNKVRISPLFFPLVGVAQNLSKQFFIFLVLFLFLYFYGLPPSIHWLALIPLILLQLLLIASVSCLIAMVIPFVRDLANLVPTGVQFIMFSSGIFFSVERIPEQWQSIFFANPIANILQQYRTIFLGASWPDLGLIGVLLVEIAFLMLLVLCFLRNFEGKFARVVLE